MNVDLFIIYKLKTNLVTLYKDICLSCIKCCEVCVLSVVWSDKPYLMKTVVKFVIIFIVATLILLPLFVIIPPLFVLWLLSAILFFIFYYFNKRAYTYYVTDKSVRIEKSWVFGTYVREITFDRIHDVYIRQGILARLFRSGSVVFTTTAGVEVGYVVAGAGSAGKGVGTGGAVVTPVVHQKRGNRFWDVRNPEKTRETLLHKIAEWREAFQQQKMATSLEKLTEKALSPPQQQAPASVVDQLEKLKKLLESGAITKEEYEKLKKKLLESL